MGRFDGANGEKAGLYAHQTGSERGLSGIGSDVRLQKRRSIFRKVGCIPHLLGGRDLILT